MARRLEDAGNLKVAKLIQLLAERQQLSSVEIAEALWLAAKMEPEELFVAEAQTNGESTGNSAASTSSTETESNSKSDLEPEPAAAEPRASLETASRAGALPVNTLPVWISDPSMIDQPLAIIKALRPLLKQIEAGIGDRLDEAATVDGIARTQMWLPVMEPETEPWFDVILVLDRGSSMSIWQRLATDLEQILRRYGAFRDLQVFDIELQSERASGANLSADRPADRPAVRLKAHPIKSQQPGHTPKELIEQRGRRIAIVLSDCAGTYWWDGTLLPMLNSWSKAMPTVIWQVLPPWMWERTALGQGKAISLSNDMAGAPNERLQRTAKGRQPLSLQELERLPVPIVTSEPINLKNWSLMLSGHRQEQAPGFVLPSPGGSVPPAVVDMYDARTDAEQDAELIAAVATENVQRFLRLSSPTAQELIMMLAAAPVITLPVMRLIRKEMLSSESPLPVAEVFLSGLLAPIPEQAALRSDELSSDEVQYDFERGVREALLRKLPAVETLEVVSKVSAAVENRWSAITSQSFRAFLTDPSILAPKGLQAMRSFGSVAANILETLGGEYTVFAEELRRGARTSAEDVQVQSEDDFKIPDLRILEFFRAEIREDIPPVQLVMDEFTVATVKVEYALSGNWSDTLAEIAAIEDQSVKAAALIEIAPQLEGALPSLIGSVIKVAQDIESDRERLRVFSTLLPYLPDGSKEQMQELIDELERQNGLELIEFEFEVAKIVRQRVSSKMGAAGRTSWTVQRNRLAAYQFIEPLGDAITLEVVAIPAGTFVMGSPESEPERYNNESPQHEVSVTAFFMGRYPITQAQWRFVAGLEPVECTLEADPSSFKGDDRPVEQVSWYEAVEFCDRLSRHTGNDYRLPSEAQWEYACRAGTQSPFYFGDTISSELANYRGTTAYNGGPQGETRNETTSVSYFNAANAFGLCDMHGNVWEWCADHWHSNYKGAPVDGSAWITENEAASRVRRGGSWDGRSEVLPLCHSLQRLRPTTATRNTGFRVCCLAPRTLQASSRLALLLLLPSCSLYFLSRAAARFIFSKKDYSICSNDRMHLRGLANERTAHYSKNSRSHSVVRADFEPTAS